MNQFLDHETIERYLQGRMTDPERVAFEAELALNPDLATQTSRQQQERRVMELLLEDQLRAKLRGWQDNDSPHAPWWQVFSGKSLWWLALALGVALLLIVMFRPDPPPPAQPTAPQPPAQEQTVQDQPVAENQPEKPAPEQPDATPKQLPPPPDNRSRYLALAESFREPVRYGESGLRQGGNDTSRFERAMDDLGNRRFRQGLAGLSALPSTDPHFQDGQYYQGLAWYDQGKFTRAIPFLQKIAANPGYLYTDQAAWFLVLAYLQANQPERGQDLARSIAADDGHIFQVKAKSLLSRLKGIE